MSQAPQSVPDLPPQPPTAPRPGASPYEWKTYRRATRDYARSQRRANRGYGPWGSGLLFAILLILVGVNYLLRNTGALPWFPDDVFWPLLLVIFGLVVLARRAGY